MGMDAYLFSAHSKKELQSEDYWKNVHLDTEDLDSKWVNCGEYAYWCKFWSLHIFINEEFCHNEYESGEFIEIDREQLKDIIEFCCFHRDYWDSFKSVTGLCEIYDHWDDIEAAGLKIFYTCDW